MSNIRVTSHAGLSLDKARELARKVMESAVTSETTLVADKVANGKRFDFGIADRGRRSGVFVHASTVVTVEDVPLGSQPCVGMAITHYGGDSEELKRFVDAVERTVTDIELAEGVEFDIHIRT